MQHNTVYVFDLDGVITNPHDSSVDPTAVGYIQSLLNAKVPVAINTGRSFDWVDQNLLRVLRGNAERETFDQLYIVCEKGGESLLWDGKDFNLQPSRFALSNAVIASCKQAFTSHSDEYDTMFWDDTKRTMASIEKLPQADLAVFHAQQKGLVTMLQDAVAGNEVRIDATTIATDAELPGAGKHAGAQLIYEWALQRGMSAPEYICFGDSTSDYEMARYFAQQGGKTSFVFVGKPSDQFDIHPDVQLVRTQNHYASGVLEYFTANPLPTL